MTEPIRFLVTLDGIRDTRQLQQRRFVAVVVSGLVLAGAALTLLKLPGGIALVVMGAFLVLAWRFPIIDGWFDRRSLVLGSECEVWLDDSGVQWRQGRDDTFTTTGHFDWSRITGLLETDRVLLIMHGRGTRRDSEGARRLCRTAGRIPRRAVPTNCPTARAISRALTARPPRGSFRPTLGP